MLPSFELLPQSRRLFRLPHLVSVPVEDSQSIEELRFAFAPAYRLERVLGAGGAAVVYLAQDTKHDRAVAIKILRAELSATLGAARFVREIRLAARLTHPNILPVLDSGEVGGKPFYSMPYVDGESLRRRLERERRLPVGEAVALILEAADALHYAHAAGIVHRDIKPENILLLSGHAMIADFGIARALTAALDDPATTTVGLVLGTPAYMSPEQAVGEAHIDGRSDVYSLATVLYEMLCGVVPFDAPTTLSLIARRLTETPERLESRCEGIPDHVGAAVAAALSTEPKDRPESAAAFARLLSGESNVVRTVTSAFPRPATPSPAAGMSDPGLPSIAVLPFANLSSDPENEFISDGITEEIMSTLSRLRTLRVAARSSSFAFKERRDDVRTIAEKLGVATVLDGSVRKAGNRIRVSAQLVDARSGLQLWSDQFDRNLDDVFAIQDEIARSIGSALRATLFDTEPLPGGGVAGPAYESYLRGRFALNKRTETELRRAVEHFERSAGIDPTFALAHAGRGDAALMLGVYGAERPDDVMPKARDAATLALQRDPSLAEAHATLGVVLALYDWDWLGAEDSFKRAIALGPRYPTAFQWYAMNVLLPLRRFEEAQRVIARARTLDPLSPVIGSSEAVVRHLSGDPEGAVAQLRHVLDIDRDFAMAHYFLGGALRDADDLEGSKQSFHAAMMLAAEVPEMTAGLAQTLARLGDVEGAREQQRRLRAAARTRYVSECLFAQVHGALGEHEEALAALERAVIARDPELAYVAARSAYDSLRRDLRFEYVVRAVLGVEHL